MKYEKDILEYIHLYMGCGLHTNISGDYIHPYGCLKVTVLDHDSFGNVYDIIYRQKKYKSEGFTDYDNIYCSLILRPLSSMTEDEAKEIGWFHDGEINYIKDFSSEWMFDSEAMLYLLKNGFDLFGLKDAGLAVYE